MIGVIIIIWCVLSIIYGILTFHFLAKRTLLTDILDFTVGLPALIVLGITAWLIWNFEDSEIPLQDDNVY